MKVINWVRQHKLLVLLLFIGSLLRFYKLDFQSPWIDEIFTLNTTGKEKSFIEIYSFLKEHDPHPPLYYFIVHFFNLIFENTSLVARIISAVFGIAGLVSIYYLGKELLNKKVGLIAVALLAVNYFHIYYSQEARMYSLLFFTTTMSFLFLIKFIKRPSFKTAFFHSVFAVLMIYTQFFALFTLFSHYMILLYFVFRPYKVTHKKFLIYCVFSGLVSFILYIPALFIFLKTSEMSSIWIPIPERDVFTSMFKEFFGFSEIAILIAIIGFVSFFTKLSSRSQAENYTLDPVKEKQTFAFFILSIWIFVSLFFPLAISFINLPMIVSRYFINIVPSILLVIAIGLYYIKNDLVKLVLMATLMLFSITDILFVKKYYDTPIKSQFREVTNEIILKNENKEKVVTYWSWLLPYFFKDKGIQIHPNSLEEYVLGLRKGNISKDSFWYLDGQYRPFNLSLDDQRYLEENFKITDKIEKIDSWAYFYKSNTVAEPVSEESFSLKNFKTVNYDANGNILIFENTSLKSEQVLLEKGNYKFEIDANSLPRKPINDENAHIRIKINGNEIGEISLSENENKKNNVIQFSQNDTQKIRVMLIYDNDIKKGNEDRNIIIYAIRIIKIP